MVALVAGCGSDEEGEQLPAGSVDQLERQLGFIERALDDGSPGACRSILEGDEPNRAEVQRILRELPDDVDAELRQATDDSFARLFDLVDQECEDLEANAEPETETTETEIETIPPETETVPPETETTETSPPEQPEPGPGNGNEGNEGNGNEGDGGAGSQGNGGGQIAPQGDE